MARILLAEDNPVNRMLTVRLLEKRAHRVTVAVDGREALDLLARESFDLVLMDVQMPQMDGFEATAAIREKEKATGDHLPIIAITAHAMKGDRERCLEAGMDAYLSKPIHIEEMFAVIEGQLRRRSRHADHPDGLVRRRHAEAGQTGQLSASGDGQAQLPVQGRGERSGSERDSILSHP